MEEEKQIKQTDQLQAPTWDRIISLFGIIGGILFLIISIFSILIPGEGGSQMISLINIGIAISLIWSSVGIRKMDSRALYVFMVLTILVLVGFIIYFVGLAVATPNQFLAVTLSGPLYLLLVFLASSSMEILIGGVIVIVLILISILFYLWSIRKKFS